MQATGRIKSCSLIVLLIGLFFIVISPLGAAVSSSSGDQSLLLGAFYIIVSYGLRNLKKWAYWVEFVHIVFFLVIIPISLLVVSFPWITSSSLKPTIDIFGYFALLGLLNFIPAFLLYRDRQLFTQ